MLTTLTISLVLTLTAAAGLSLRGHYYDDVNFTGH
jgi:hypothetical protein